MNRRRCNSGGCRSLDLARRVLRASRSPENLRAARRSDRESDRDQAPGRARVRRAEELRRAGRAGAGSGSPYLAVRPKGWRSRGSTVHGSKPANRSGRVAGLRSARAGACPRRRRPTQNGRRGDHRRLAATDSLLLSLRDRSGLSAIESSPPSIACRPFAVPRTRPRPRRVGGRLPSGRNAACNPAVSKLRHDRALTGSRRTDEP